MHKGHNVQLNFMTENFRGDVYLRGATNTGGRLFFNPSEKGAFIWVGATNLGGRILQEIRYFDYSIERMHMHTIICHQGWNTLAPLPKLTITCSGVARGGVPNFFCLRPFQVFLENVIRDAVTYCEHGQFLNFSGFSCVF